MSSFQTRRWVMLICALIGFSHSLNAHDLNETTAQVILRDGQIEVRLITDIEHVISVLQNNQAWLLGDIDAVMPENLNLKQQDSFIKNALEQKMRLLVNKKSIAFERATLSKKSNENEGEFVFQAQHTFSEVNDISISFHPILGPVHVSFVKPKYKLVAPGEAAHIAF